MKKQKTLFLLVLIFSGFSNRLNSYSYSQCQKIAPGHCVAVADVPGSAFGAQVWEPVRY